MRADVRACGHGSKLVCVFPPAEDFRERFCWSSSRIAIARSNMCGARILSFVRPTASPVQEVARRASVRPTCGSGAGKRDTLEQGVEGLLRDRTCKPGRAPLSPKVVAKVLDLTSLRAWTRPRHALDLAAPWPKPPASACARCKRLQGRRIGRSRTASAPSSAPTRSLSSPRRSRTSPFRPHTWIRPRTCGFVVSIDEGGKKLQIQALDRGTQPGLPPASAGKMRDDDP